MAVTLSKLLTYVRSKEARRGQYRRMLWRNLHPFLDNVVLLGIGNGSEVILTPSTERVLTGALLAHGHFQKDNLQTALRIVERHRLRMGGYFVDVGANIGSSSVYALNTSAFKHAVCIEPEPNNIRLLRANLILNSLDKKATVIEAAASASEAELTLHLSKRNSGDHRAWPDPKWPRRAIQVRGAPLDSLLRETGIEAAEVSLIWIDTQGYEGSVLAGASGILSEQVPVVMEFWPWGLEQTGTLETCLGFLRQNFRYMYDLSEGSNATTRDVREIQDLAVELGSRSNTAQTDLLFLNDSRSTSNSG